MEIIETRVQLCGFLGVVGVLIILVLLDWQQFFEMFNFNTDLGEHILCIVFWEENIGYIILRSVCCQ